MSKASEESSSLWSLTMSLSMSVLASSRNVGVHGGL